MANFYTLTINECPGADITVKRTVVGEANTGLEVGRLKNGDTLCEGDILRISTSVNPGCTIIEKIIDGVEEQSTNRYKVTGDVLISVIAAYTSYTITINKVSDAKTIVERVESPLAGAATCKLIDGDNIYYGDILTITVKANEHFVLPDIIYNGLKDSDHISPVYTSALKIVGKKVVGNAEISAAEELYRLLFHSFVDSTYNVQARLKRISSPLAGADLTDITLDLNVSFNSWPVYYGDVLQDITPFSSEEYELKGLKLHSSFDIIDVEIPRGGTYTVPYLERSGILEADLIVKKRDGLVSIDNGTSFEKYMIYIDNGTSWDRYLPYIDNGTSWDLYN